MVPRSFLSTNKASFSKINDRTSCRPRFVFVDYENVGAQDVRHLGEADRVWVFVGHNNKKLPLDFVASIHALHDRAVYVHGIPQARNALDSVLMFVLGQVSAKYENADFFVVSKDTDFDPLILWMRTLGYSIKRVQSVDLVCDHR